MPGLAAAHAVRESASVLAAERNTVPTASVVVCDDHRLFVEALSITLAHEGFVVEAAVATPQDALAAVALHRPEILLTDLRFPTGDGLAIAREVIDVFPETRVVVITASAEAADIVAAEAMGVAGYLRKDERMDGIVAALRLVAEGVRHFDKALLRRLSAGEPEPTGRRGAVLRLTTQEQVVLTCLSDGLSTSDMVSRLGISHTTVRSHIQAILSKLGVHSRIQAVALLNEGDRGLRMSTT